MLFALSLTVGILVIALIGVLAYALYVPWRDRRRAYPAFREQMDARVRGRSARAVDVILTETWGSMRGVPDVGQLRPVWLDLARYLQIDLEMLRPSDSIAALYVGSEWFWPDLGDEFIDFFAEWVPDADPLELAKVEYDTVKAMVDAAIDRSACPSAVPQ